MSKKKNTLSANELMSISEMSENVVVSRLETENAMLKEKIAMLEKSLSEQSASKILGLDVAPEELICLEQIKLIENTSRARELTLDEVKKLDLLIKNLRLIKNQSTENLNPSYRDVSEAELVAIASKKE
jgi:predicted nucleotidyltransferase component of viral defense system